MLISEETVEDDGSRMIHHYSDAKRYIRQLESGETYAEAWDPIEFKDVRHYEETDEEIIDPEPSLMDPEDL